MFYNEQKTSKKQQHPHFFSLFFSLIKKGCKCITTQTPKTKKYSRLLQKIVAKPLQRYKIYPIQKKVQPFHNAHTPKNYEFCQKSQSSISSSLLAISLPGVGIIVIFTKSSFVSCSNLVDANFGIT